MKAKIKVAVLMGGQSLEHEVSLLSGKEVVKALSGNEKFEVLPIVISKDGSNLPLTQLIQEKIDVIFIALHGSSGEDGTVQGMFEMIGIPYTGSGVLSSVLGMNKFLFRKLLAGEGIAIPKYHLVKKSEAYDIKVIQKKLGAPPYVIKPHNQGSSVGVSLVKEKQNLVRAINLAFGYSELVLIDEYIKGIELTCGVIGNNNPFSLPLVEIVSKNDFFDYEAKYLSKKTKEIVPARIDKKITKKVQEIAVKVYKLLDCRGFARIDFLLRGDQVYVLEINTIPGLTRMSLLPKAAKAVGLAYSQLIEQIIDFALER